MKTSTPISVPTIVKRTTMLGGTVILSVWEPSTIAARVHAGHHTVTSFDRDDWKWWGRIGTRRVPAEIDALPAMTPERSAAVQKWYKDQCEEAYAIIEACTPEVKGLGYRTSGEILLYQTASSEG